MPWEAVRVVKYLVSPVGIQQQHQQQRQRDISTEICPICLDVMHCARITKCGHCFCLSCLVHHVQSFIDKTQHPKCPCCSIPLHLEDLRPVILVNVVHPSITTPKFRFVKLHRGKDCPAPYLPVPDQPRRSAPLVAAPSAGDADAPYSRFNYVDFGAYQQLLHANYQELLEIQQEEQGHAQMSTLEELCLGLALQMVQQEQHKATEAAAEELLLQEQFLNPTAGIYLPQQPHLLAAAAVGSGEEERNSSWVPLSPTAAARSSTASSWDAHEGGDLPPVSTPDVVTAQAQEPVSPLPEQRSTAHRGDDPISDRNVTVASDHVGTMTRRERGDSIASYGAASACSHYSQSSSGTRPIASGGGSMYLDEDDEYVLYQAEDGSLCFLSGFNMNCLRTEFSTAAPQVFDERATVTSLPSSLDQDEQNLQANQATRRPPLPDVVEGRVLAVERVHLTADLRQRRRFLSHLPLYSDLCFVEISMGHILSNRTKKAFKNEFQKRNQARLNQQKAEKRADERERRKEEARINELKARMQRIDPSDEFFQPVVTPAAEPEPVMTGDAFGPVMSNQSSTPSAAAGDATRPAPPESESQTTTMSFSQICRAGEDFPTLDSAPNETNFPALGSSPPTTAGRRRAPAPRPWGNNVKTAPPAAPAVDASLGVPLPSSPSSPSQPRGKKGKAKKIVLFSTGAQRGGNY